MLSPNCDIFACSNPVCGSAVPSGRFATMHRNTSVAVMNPSQRPNAFIWKRHAQELATILSITCDRVESGWINIDVLHMLIRCTLCCACSKLSDGVAGSCSNLCAGLSADLNCEMNFAARLSGVDEEVPARFVGMVDRLLALFASAEVCVSSLARCNALTLRSN